MTLLLSYKWDLIYAYGEKWKGNLMDTVILTNGSEASLNVLMRQVKGLNPKRIIFSSQVNDSQLNEYCRLASVLYIQESPGLGSGGVLKKAISLCETEDVLVFKGESFFEINLQEMRTVHEKYKSELTIACKEANETLRYNSVIFDQAFKVSGFFEKELSIESGWVNGGIYMIHKDMLKQFPDTPFSLEKDALPKLLNKRVYAFPTKV